LTDPKGFAFRKFGGQSLKLGLQVFARQRLNVSERLFERFPLKLAVRQPFSPERRVAPGVQEKIVELPFEELVLASNGRALERLQLSVEVEYPCYEIGKLFGKNGGKGRQRISVNSKHEPDFFALFLDPTLAARPEAAGCCV
jgi:hypothetical protein